MKRIIIMTLAIACMIPVLNSCKDKTWKEVMSTEESGPTTEVPSETEAETEPTTEPATEAPTEAPTEALPEPPTEAPTEASTEPPTEAPTEPEMEFTIKGRETMLEGQQVTFHLGYSSDDEVPWKYGPDGVAGALNYVQVPIKDGSSLDNKRSICVCIARTLPEFKEAVSIFRPEDALTEYDKYDETYFRNHVLLILYGGLNVGGKWTAEMVTKKGAELCIGLSDTVRISNPNTVYPAMTYLIQQGLEISKEDFGGIDTISIFDQAINTR